MTIYLLFFNLALAQPAYYCPTGRNDECPTGYRCQITWSDSEFYCVPRNPQPTPPPEDDSQCRHPWVC